MSLYFLKPVVWNSYGYLKPSGATFTSGYPKQHGFGHEEWNNSDRYLFKTGGRNFRVFHTEGFGNQPLANYGGDIFVFMFASYSGEQYLVAVAGRATAYFGDDNQRQRRKLIKNIGLDDDRWRDAWAVESVKEAYKGDRQSFLRQWRKELHWLPTWMCPAELYLGLKHPVRLSPTELTGKQRLIARYGSYQEIGRHVALKLLDSIPAKESPQVVSALKTLCEDSDADVATDLTRIETEGPQNETTRKALVDARLGQGKFRAQVLAAWADRCAVTGCTVREVLRASHVKPWCDCLNSERLDPENGLPLVAHLDLLFDSGLISFDKNGRMLVSVMLTKADRSLLHLGRPLRRVPSKRGLKFLKYHRDTVFRGSSS